MRFNEIQKRRLIKMINDKIINNPDKVECFCDHQVLNDQYVFKFSDVHYDIDIIIHDYSKFHKDIEIDVHDKINQRSLIFDSHQYFINPKDIKIMIKLLIELFNSKDTTTNKDKQDTEFILNENK